MLEGIAWSWTMMSGVVGVVGVVPYDFIVVRSSCVSRKIGMPGKAGHCFLLWKAEACSGVDMG
jgi:hypothetical protein